MATSRLEEILEQARELSPADQSKLVEKLKQTFEPTEPTAAQLQALEQWLSRAGTGASAFKDVASDKYKHLSDIYSNDE